MQVAVSRIARTSGLAVPTIWKIGQEHLFEQIAFDGRTQRPGSFQIRVRSGPTPLTWDEVQAQCGQLMTGHTLHSSWLR